MVEVAEIAAEWVLCWWALVISWVRPVLDNVEQHFIFVILVGNVIVGVVIAVSNKRGIYYLFVNKVIIKKENHEDNRLSLYIGKSKQSSNLVIWMSEFLKSKY